MVFLRRKSLGLLCLIVAIATIVIGSSRSFPPYFASNPIHSSNRNSLSAQTQQQALALAAPMKVPQADCPISLFGNLGNYHRPITTRSPLAQQYFDQGMVLTYGFNHPEAIRSFQEAARLDPDCAMCHWGIALASGPHINAGMSDEAVQVANQALQTAIGLSKQAPAAEQAYIQALATRYAPEPVADRKPLNQAYTTAMRQLAHRYPDDPDVATLFGEALMNSTNWFSWDSSNPNPESLELLKTLESALKLNPDHPGANHYYIHVIEQSPYPEKGISSADRLMDLAPGSGHLLHMPSHLYLKQGRYHEAVVTNQNGVKADLAYLSSCHPKGGYLRSYVLHNYHFLWNAASLAGESQAALQAARLANNVIQLYEQTGTNSGAKQFHAAMPLYTMSHFGLWDEILQEQAPDTDLPYLTGVWHFTRGNAFRAQGQLQQAKQELQQLQTIAANPSLARVMIESNSAAALLELASTVLAAGLDAQEGRYTVAISQLQEAVAMEDNLAYVEPRAWYSPVRQVLGAVLLAADKPEEAEAVYRQDLGKHPENGWSLYGLNQSLSAQGKFSEAKNIQSRFEKAWQNADVNLLASYF